MTKVAIDIGSLKSGHKVRGIGVHTKELVGELKKIKNGDFQINDVDFSGEDLAKYDIAHYTSFNPYFFSVPFQKPTKKVVLTIHDLIYLIYPTHYPPGLKGEVKFLLQKYLLKNIDAFITISETSKKDICRFLNVDPSRIFVTPLAHKEVFRQISNKRTLKEIKEKYNLPDEFVLYVGDINYNKNIPTLIEACKLADMPLVMVGKKAKDLATGGVEDLRNLNGPMDWARFIIGIPHPELAHYSKLLRKMNKQRVSTLGFVDDMDLVKIFNLATLYCQPSYYEGFGLAVLEAMATGVPVVCSKTQALVEVSGEAALFADAQSAKDFANKFLRIKKDGELRKSLSMSGLKNVQNYSWTQTAKETLEAYKSLI